MRSFTTSACIAVIIITLFSAGQSPAQRSTGAINGKIIDPASRLGSGATVRLIEESSNSVVQSAVPTPSGEFRFLDVPLAEYRIVVISEQATLAIKSVVVESPVPVDVTIDSLREYTMEEVLVEARTAPHTADPQTHSFYSAERIAELPAPSSDKRIESMLLSSAGVVPDEDGRMHFRGEDAQLQYVIDGIPVTGNMTRIYSTLLNSDIIKSADILTGGLQAEYGVAAAGVVAVNTRSGFDAGHFVKGSVGGGSFGSREGTIQAGGNSGSVGYFLLGSAARSDRYLDPVISSSPNHTAGDDQSYFGKLDFLLSDRADLVVLGSLGSTRYEIPNTLVKTPPQDQRQELQNYLAGARLNYLTSPTSALSLVGYTRRAEATLTSGGLREITSSADSAQAVAENEKFFLGGNRINRVVGGQAEYAMRIGQEEMMHNLKSGISAENFPLHEFFTFAVTDPALSDPSQQGGDDRYLPYDITKGGHPFLVNQDRSGSRFSAYIQDEIDFGRWAFDLGVRYDRFNLFGVEDGVSPRVGIAFAINPDITVRGSYNRIIMQAPVENILVSSSAQASALSGTEQGGTPLVVRSEREHVAELGGSWRISRLFTADIAGYYKSIDNFIVKVELENSGMIFPANLREGLVAGGELRLTMSEWHKLSGVLTFSTCASMGKIPEDGSSPFAAGLFLGEEAERYRYPWAGEDMFKTEHNQLLTSTLNLAYRLSDDFTATIGGRFDSGLPFDLTDSLGNGLSPEQARQELRARGYSDDVIDLLSLESESPGSPDKSVAPHFTFDLGARYTFYRSGTLTAGISLGVNNVLDTRYLYKFESAFGGTHYGAPRMVAARLEFSY